MKVEHLLVEKIKPSKWVLMALGDTLLINKHNLK